MPSLPSARTLRYQSRSLRTESTKGQPFTVVVTASRDCSETGSSSRAISTSGSGLAPSSAGVATKPDRLISRARAASFGLERDPCDSRNGLEPALQRVHVARRGAGRHEDAQLGRRLDQGQRRSCRPEHARRSPAAARGQSRRGRRRAGRRAGRSRTIASARPSA